MSKIKQSNWFNGKYKKNMDYKNPIISFRPKGKTKAFLNKFKNKDYIINQSILRNIYFIENTKELLKELISRDYDFAKYLLRKEGAKIKHEKNKIKKIKFSKEIKKYMNENFEYCKNISKLSNEYTDIIFNKKRDITIHEFMEEKLINYINI